MQLCSVHAYESACEGFLHQLFFSFLHTPLSLSLHYPAFFSANEPETLQVEFLKRNQEGQFALLRELKRRVEVQNLKPMQS